MHLQLYRTRYSCSLSWALNDQRVLPSPPTSHVRYRPILTNSSVHNFPSKVAMYINPAQYAQTFQDIKRSSSSHSTCRLILFVSCLSIDSICTAKILSVILKKSLIQYQLIPVVGYTDLKEHYQKLDSEVANVILIGCGAMIDIETFFEIDVNEFVSESVLDSSQPLFEDLDKASRTPGVNLRRKIYIIDGNRPWNLDNVFGSDMVVCFDDGYIDKNLQKEKDSYKVLVDASDHELDEEEEESEDSESEDNEDEIIIGSGDELDPDSSLESRKRRHGNEAKRLRKQRRKALHTSEDVIETYYNQGTAIFTATTAIIYALLATIGETNLDNLWLSIIGVSSLDRFHPEVYDKILPLFKEEVHRLNPSNSTNGAGNERTADSNTLAIDKDYHLFLLRHWTLYDSFFYSSMVNSKLNLWTEDGKKKLHKLFAKMGISLSTAQQKWLYMDITVKKNLPVIFNKYLPLYGLEGVVREGFVRTFGYMGQLSAIECVESLAALLESDDKSFGRDNKTPENEETEQDEINARIEKKEKLWVNNFWSSWDALNMTTHGSASRIVSSSTKNPIGNIKKLKGFDLLIHGLDSAKEIQQTIFKTGMSVLERKLIKNLRLYRLCVLNDGAIPDLNLFSNPLILSKLGNWLLENINELEFLNISSKSGDSKLNALKPLVVASLDVMSDTYLVIGLAPKYPRGLDNSTRAKIAQSLEMKTKDMSLMTRLNTFSVAFQKVSATSGAKVRINSFDSSIIEIRRDDLSPFLEKLTLSGLI